MHLKQFIEIAEAEHVTPEEYAQFARLVALYLDARAAGAQGLRQEDVDPDDVEVLVERFDPPSLIGHCYTHPAIDLILAEKGAPSRTDQQFERFWLLYPRKVAKLAAKKAWVRLIKTEADAKKANQALVACIKAEQWLSRDPHYIPHAATWLNQGRHLDDYKAPKAAGGEFAGVV